MQVLTELLQQPQAEKPTGTGRVLTSPSGMSNKLVMNVVGEMPLDAVIRDLGNSAAREVATILEGMTLRPADYATLPQLPETLRTRLTSVLTKEPEKFAKAFTDALHLKG
jgi:hypothetical protein